MKIFYHADNDGKCAAFLFWKWIEREKLIATQEDFIEIDYNRKLPIEKISEGESVYFLDFHPEVASDYVWLSEHSQLFIIDHHITTNDHLQEMRDQYNLIPRKQTNNIIDISACGAMLVAKHFLKISDDFFDDYMPLFVRYVDDWDRWEKKLPDSEMFNAGSELYDTSPFGGFWDMLYNEHYSNLFSEFLPEVVFGGEILLRARKMRAKDLVETIGFEAEFEGYRCFCLNQSRCNITWFESVPDYDIWLTFYYNGKVLTISLYSTKVDVSVLAKKYGGGGHKGAAGFVCDELPFNKI